MYHRRKIHVAESKALSRYDIVKFVPKVTVITCDHHVKCEISKGDVQQDRGRAGELTSRRALCRGCQLAKVSRFGRFMPYGMGTFQMVRFSIIGESILY